MKSNNKIVLNIYLLSIVLAVLISNQKANCEISCKNDSDCRSYYSCKDNFCTHKDFFPIKFFQVIEIILVLLFSSVATACGVGGGAIYSTLLMLLENFEASKAFPISNFMILLSSLSVYVLGAKMSINVPEHKFVDYDLVLVFAPMLLLGTKIGVILNNILPSIALTAFLVYTLYSSTSKIYKSYKKIKNEEDEEEEAERLKEELEEKELQEIDTTNNEKKIFFRK